MKMRKAEPGDYPRLEALSEAEGWNYREGDFADLERTGCATTTVVIMEGAVRGMVTAMDYGEVAWISNMLIEREYRGRGAGAELLRQGVRSLGAKRTVALFSYSDTVEYYLRQGFRLEGDYAVVRYIGGHAGRHGDGEPKVEDVAAIDFRAFSGARAGLLKMLAGKGRLFVPPKGEGFAIARRDQRESSVGPVICDDASAGMGLLYAASNYLGAGAMAVLVGKAPEGFETVGRVHRLYLGEGPRTDAGIALAFAGLEFG